MKSVFQFVLRESFGAAHPACYRIVWCIAADGPAERLQRSRPRTRQIRLANQKRAARRANRAKRFIQSFEFVQLKRLLAYGFQGVGWKFGRWVTVRGSWCALRTTVARPRHFPLLRRAFWAYGVAGSGCYASMGGCAEAGRLALEQMI